MSLYRHHKGGLYRVLFQATDSTNETAGRPLIVYVSLTTGQVHVRTLSEFVDIINGVPRFAPEGT